MAMWLCRWVNGEFSLVEGLNRADALEKLYHETRDNAEGVPMFRMKTCALHGKVTATGELVVYSMGEDTESEVLRWAYPRLDTALSEAELDEETLDYTERGKEHIRLSVEEEMSRVKLRDVREPEDTVTRSVKRVCDMPTVVAEQMREQALEDVAEFLETMDDPPKKFQA